MRPKNLAELMKSFTHVRLADESEGAALSSMMRAQFMNLKGTGIGFDRGSDFFSLFRVYTRQYWVFAILNDDGSIAGVASLTRFRANVRGESRWIGYFGDLRLDPKASHQAHKQWREAYSAIVLHLENPESDEHCGTLITAVFQENLRAMQIFKKRLKGVVYHDLCPYWNLSVFSAILSRPAKTLKVTRAGAEAVEELERPSLSLLEPPSDPLCQPLVARDQSGRAIAGAVLWDARNCRSLRVINLPRLLRLGFLFLSRISQVKYSESDPWIMKCLSRISWSPTLTREERLEALSAMIRFSFNGGKPDFHILNLTLMDSALCDFLKARFPVSRVTEGWVFEVTSASRPPTIVGESVVLEGAFL